MIEVIIAVFIAFLSAAAGGYIGFYFGRVRDDRLRTVDFALSLLAENFTLKRVRFLNTLKKLNPSDLKTAANQKVDEFEPFRRDCFEIFNTYELICLLKVKGDLDKSIFETQIHPIIAADYQLVDELFDEIVAYQQSVDGDIARPFYEHIAKIAPRQPAERKT